MGASPPPAWGRVGGRGLDRVGWVATKTGHWHRACPCATRRFTAAAPPRLTPPLASPPCPRLTPLPSPHPPSPRFIPLPSPHPLPSPNPQGRREAMSETCGLVLIWLRMSWAEQTCGLTQRYHAPFQPFDEGHPVCSGARLVSTGIGRLAGVWRDSRGSAAPLRHHLRTRLSGCLPSPPCGEGVGAGGGSGGLSQRPAIGTGRAPARHAVSLRHPPPPALPHQGGGRRGVRRAVWS